VRRQFAPLLGIKGLHAGSGPPTKTFGCCIGTFGMKSAKDNLIEVPAAIQALATKYSS